MAGKRGCCGGESGRFWMGIGRVKGGKRGRLSWLKREVYGWEKGKGFGWEKGEV